jgi:hypothetical protein
MNSGGTPPLVPIGNVVDMYRKGCRSALKESISGISRLNCQENRKCVREMDVK